MVQGSIRSNFLYVSRLKFPPEYQPTYSDLNTGRSSHACEYYIGDNDQEVVDEQIE